MKSRPIIIAVAASVSISACSTLSADLEAKHRATSQWMIEQERAWADMACGVKWVASMSGAAWFGRIRGFGAMASGKSLPFKTTESSVLQSDALPDFGPNGRGMNKLAVVLLRRAGRLWR
jgi:hypothetical protein